MVYHIVPTARAMSAVLRDSCCCDFQSVKKPSRQFSLFRCYHEHLDLFTEISRPDSASNGLIETPFGGRHCGKIPPRPRISLYRALSFVFLSDRDNVTDARFSGYYKFIPDGECFAAAAEVLEWLWWLVFGFL